MIQMDSDQKLTFTNGMIPSCFSRVETSQIPIDKHFDDCFHCETEVYRLQTKTTGLNSHLQQKQTIYKSIRPLKTQVLLLK